MTTANTTRESDGVQPRFIVPFARHDGFVGREADLAEVHRAVHFLDWHPPGTPASHSRSLLRHRSSPPPASNPRRHDRPVTSSKAPTPMPFRQHLTHAEITELDTTAGALGLTTSRTPLFKGITPSYIASLATSHAGRSARFSVPYP